MPVDFFNESSDPRHDDELARMVSLLDRLELPGDFAYVSALKTGTTGMTPSSRTDTKIMKICNLRPSKQHIPNTLHDILMKYIPFLASSQQRLGNDLRPSVASTEEIEAFLSSQTEEAAWMKSKGMKFAGELELTFHLFQRLVQPINRMLEVLPLKLEEGEIVFFRPSSTGPGGRPDIEMVLQRADGSQVILFIIEVKTTKAVSNAAQEAITTDIANYTHQFINDKGAVRIKSKSETKDTKTIRKLIEQVSFRLWHH